MDRECSQWVRFLPMPDSWTVLKSHGCPPTVPSSVLPNQQSLDKFESKVKPGGTLIYDPYSIHHAPTRTDIKIYPVDAMEATFELPSSKAYNMVLLGSLLKIRNLLPVEAVMKGLKKTLPERHHHLLPINKDAILKGMELPKP